METNFTLDKLSKQVFLSSILIFIAVPTLLILQLIHYSIVIYEIIAPTTYKGWSVAAATFDQISNMLALLELLFLGICALRASRYHKLIEAQMFSIGFIIFSALEYPRYLKYAVDNFYAILPQDGVNSLKYLLGSVMVIFGIILILTMIVISFFSVKFYFALEIETYSKKTKINQQQDSKPLLINKSVKLWSLYTKIGSIILIIVSVIAFIVLMIGTLIFFYSNISILKFTQVLTSTLLFFISFYEKLIWIALCTIGVLASFFYNFRYVQMFFYGIITVAIHVFCRIGSGFYLGENLNSSVGNILISIFNTLISIVFLVVSAIIIYFVYRFYFAMEESYFAYKATTTMNENTPINPNKISEVEPNVPQEEEYSTYIE
eukprot:gene10077-2498_t